MNLKNTGTSVIMREEETLFCTFLNPSPPPTQEGLGRMGSAVNFSWVRPQENLQNKIQEIQQARDG